MVLKFICSPDPLVFVAWKCTKLVEMVFIGHKYAQENLLAIARLRESTLHRLVFSESDIASEESTYEAENIMEVSFFRFLKIILFLTMIIVIRVATVLENIEMSWNFFLNWKISFQHEKSGKVRKFNEVFSLSYEIRVKFH